LYCSTYGVSGAKWHYAARAAVQTMMGSFGGGCIGLGYSMFLREGRLDIMDLINGILGSLVSVTGTGSSETGLIPHQNVIEIYVCRSDEGACAMIPLLKFSHKINVMLALWSLVVTILTTSSTIKLRILPTQYIDGPYYSHNR